MTLAGDGNINAGLLARPTTTRPTGSTASCKKILNHVGFAQHHVLHKNFYSHMNIPAAGVAHQAGTCRFGHDPATSVLDENCKAHELDNLYVVDTSFFPSIGAVNPALTAMANALRVGDHLIDRLELVTHDDHLMATKPEIDVVYAAGLVQGIVLVTFPAASTIFTDPADYDLSSTQYGALFLPQVVTAIAGLAARRRRWPDEFAIKRVYLARAGVQPHRHGCSSSPARRSPTKSSAFTVLLIGHRLRRRRLRAHRPGAQHASPRRSTPTASTGRCSCSTPCSVSGTALAPVFVAVFVGLGFWWGLPVLSAVLLGAPPRRQRPACRCRPDAPSAGRARRAADRARLIPRAVLALRRASPCMYGICETMNGNWAQARHDDASSGPRRRSPRWPSPPFWGDGDGRARRVRRDRSAVFPTRRTYHLLPFVLAAALGIDRRSCRRARPVAGVLAFGRGRASAARRCCR